MIRILISAILLTASFSPTLVATKADVWTITGDVQGYPVAETCTFTTNDGVLAGPCTLEKVTYQATGTVKDKAITFKHGGTYNGQDLTLTFTGTLDDSGKLQGTIAVDPLAVSGTFTATKSTPPSTT